MNEPLKVGFGHYAGWLDKVGASVHGKHIRK